MGMHAGCWSNEAVLVVDFHVLKPCSLQILHHMHQLSVWMTVPSSMFSTMAVVGMLLRGKIQIDYMCANLANNMGHKFF
jgi:hypothetical protein